MTANEISNKVPLLGAAGGSIVLIIGAILLVLALLFVAIGIPAAITAWVNIWAVGQGGFLFVWGVNIALSIVIATVSLFIQFIAALVGAAA